MQAVAWRHESKHVIPRSPVRLGQAHCDARGACGGRRHLAGRHLRAPVVMAHAQQGVSGT